MLKGERKSTKLNIKGLSPPCIKLYNSKSETFVTSGQTFPSNYKLLNGLREDHAFLTGVPMRALLLPTPSCASQLAKAYSTSIKDALMVLAHMISRLAM
jgi:hypothetical protein